MKSKVFLGGTCNGSTWREKVIPLLNYEFFNPVVENWTPECQIEEERQKNEVCDIHLYVITPKIKGVFSIAEAVESSMTDGKKCIFCVVAKEEDGTLFSDEMTRSLLAVMKIIRKHGGQTFTKLTDTVIYLNSLKEE